MVEGSETTIRLRGNNEVPADVIKAIADKKLKATFVFDDKLSWQLDGAEIETPTAAKLKITTVTSLDSSSLRGTAGMKFRIDGTDNPTELTISFNKKEAGKFANLYRKNGDELVFVDNVKVDKNGYARGLEVEEKGDYVVMLCEFSDRLGDANNDGIVNAVDASTILRRIVELGDAENVEMLDYNGDGKINALDAAKLLQDLVAR